MVSERYEGFCSGGPYDGQWAWEKERECWVAYDSIPPLAQAGEVLPMIVYGCYRFNLGRWIWSAENATHPKGQRRPTPPDVGQRIS
jgi:hypothetical protein